MLTSARFVALLPLMLVAASAVTVMLGIAWRRQHAATVAVTALGLSLALVAQVIAWQAGPVQTPLLAFDGLAMLGGVLILGSTLICAILSHAYLEQYRGAREEFYLLLLCAAAGGLTLAASRHLASLFVGLELLSMPLYGMLAYAYRERRSLEAGVKYLILSAAASAFLLFGMALLYAQTGELRFDVLLVELSGETGLWGLAGVGMMVVGLGFKLSVVPFHLWTPDVYEGGPAPAATFLATASKVAVFFLLLRLVLDVPGLQGRWLQTLLAILALASMLVGNLLALTQSNLKRLLGYSSIAHFGYLLVTLVVGDGLAAETGGVYLITYVLTTLAAFGVVTLISGAAGGEDVAALHYYRGLFWRRPYLTAVLTIAMLSLAGIPATVGFIGKFYIIALGVEASRWWLVGGIILGSAIGLYYYLRVMVTLYLLAPGMQRRDAPHDWGARAGGLVVLGVALAVIVLGLYPAPMIDMAAQLGGVP
ncbi:NADH-quinone oxidoreductase subunit NuoN [Halomonas sp. KAO]|uniref:NADH-quinone oxidoreductase subunit NuoN n=1 Tax=unclassified Halomonas TaxID=2609666 RepID=UPI00189F45C1|nr:MULTISPECIES: NADH-quinone oxidoreductase subunit NuoN [unclassified Halomonas]MBF7053559.1 NADH-quinone oxidoreductase subunit NuoN [Halomonas sp. KAO]MDT0500838.1 NADH-quinone oxidoreductase subunit NuoN [Halomonas sp. PAR7]MDT0512574.1 NADH-quinone oxidoreductase subunit NuoN [Halomonas sp. LES1]MDT0592844.1 NADH-quinone oxidoreductase subunit NuoN [Halomonas sp. PAR8]